MTRQNGFLGTSSGLSGPLLPTSAFQATALVAPPPGGLEHGVKHHAGHEQYHNGAEQDWFHPPYRVVGQDQRWSVVFRWFSLFVDTVTLSLGL